MKELPRGAALHQVAIAKVLAAPLVQVDGLGISRPVDPRGAPAGHGVEYPPVDWTALPRHVEALSLGKRVPDGVYLHVDLLPKLPEALRQVVEEARVLARLEPDAFNVVRFTPAGCKVSLLAYPAFHDEAFPALASSCAVDLRARSASLRKYDPSGNPPILHRKELLLPSDHPRAAEYSALTQAVEQRGLFSDARSIGTKRVWEAKLRRLRLLVEGHTLREADDSDRTVEDADVHRHRTALQRYSLSAPMQALWRHGLLQGRTAFDYGCGRGDDVRILEQLGVVARGWDPHFAPKQPRLEADVVNLGYVINVIEDLRERRDALVGAFTLARKVLAVAALIGGRTAYEQHRLFRDGVLTSRNTFQKYFSQQELREYLEETLAREPVAVAPGIFLVFKEDEEEQRFLAARQTLARCLTTLPRTERTQRAREARPSRWEQHRELLDDFWQRCVELGRLPKDMEYARLPELRGSVGSPQSVLRRLSEERGEDSLKAARSLRMEDLLVYLALNVFERRKSFGHLPDTVQRDIAGFWGSYAAAREEATRLLFSIAKPTVILEACKASSVQGIGYLDGDHSLQLHTSQVPRLPAVLRVYVSCAARLYGDITTADLVKIHVQSGKLTLMTYDDCEGKALPRLLERVKVNMRTQQVQFFDYGPETPEQLLYNKSRYIPQDFPNYEKQVRFDTALGALGIDLGGHGPDAVTLHAALARTSRLRVAGFSLRRLARDSA